jgi:hypothetical protein
MDESVGMESLVDTANRLCLTPMTYFIGKPQKSMAALAWLIAA